MLQEGDTAPTFEAPMATPENAAGKSGEFTSEEVEPFALSDALAEGPVALAFFPGAFSRTCTREMCQMRDWWAGLADLPGSVYGVSADPPFPQLAFVDRYDLSFPLLSTFNNDVLEGFGVRVEAGILRGIARRSTFVLAPDRTIEYAWATEESLTFPDLEAMASAMESA
ncbi:MAG: redoxin domain-containing protein [Haloarculaceae archaeon]